MEFLRCLGIPSISAYAFSLGLFLFAFVFYWASLAALRKIFRKDGFWKVLIEAVRFPVLIILLEIAAIVSIDILGLKELYAEVLEHTVSIIILATIGWLLMSVTRALFHHFYFKYEDESSVSVRQRAMLTQVQFLYRIIMFGIFAVTLASILLTFPQIKSLGIGILSSAGIIGIVLGVAARPVFLNLIAGFQIALTKTIKIGDAVCVENEFARIETIHLTHVIIRTWDLRRLILPISYFIDQPFQNWDTKNPELLGSVFIYCDYSVPVEIIRQKAEEIIASHPNWNKRIWRLQVTNCSEKTIELRVLMTANDAGSTFELRCFVREKLIEFLQKEYPDALPCVRFKELEPDLKRG